MNKQEMMSASNLESNANPVSIGDSSKRSEAIDIAI